MPLTSLLLSCLVTLAPSDAGPPRGPVFINERAVPIPVNCERPELVQKVDLYVSADQGKQWHLYAAIQPTQKEISFVAPTDGEYWFDLVTTFKDGRSEPRAPGLQPPLLVLIVDTKPPRITLRPQDSSDGQASVAWEIEDDHLDLRSLKLEYRDATTGSWVSLPVIPPSAKGEKRWPVHGTGSVLVRLSVSDLAENQAQAQVEIPLGKGSGQFAVAGGQPDGRSPVGGQGTVAASAATTPAMGLQVSPWPSSHGQNLPAAGSTAGANTGARTFSPAENLPSVVPPPPPPPGSATTATNAANPGTPAFSPASSAQHASSQSYGPQSFSSALPASAGTVSPAQASALPPPPAPLPAETAAPRVIARSDSSGLPTQLASWNQHSPGGTNTNFRSRFNLPTPRYLNSTRASLQYEISRVGPSGIGSVEVWMTRDDGRTWFKAAEDPDLQPPVQVEFPGEGVYGLTLVVRSRAGLGRQPPQPGEPPDLRVEVDLTPPYAELYNVEADPQRRDCLILLWSATDKNLAANPITLKWAERESGPWQVIAADLPNTGRYVWKMPEHLPYMVYLRLEARDLAGNLAVAQTPKPILVDLQEPEVKLLDITPPLDANR
jgi:hypothetical protein